MVGPWEMFYSVIDLAVWIACSFGAKFPYCPHVAMFVVKEFDEGVGWVTVSALWICRGWARRGDYWQGIRQ